MTPYPNNKLFVSKDELWSTDDGPLFSRREESLVTFPTLPSIAKVRIGGSRSTTLTPNRPTIITKAPDEHLEPMPKTVDTDTASSVVDTNSLNKPSVRIMGRGGAGARPRTHSKDRKSASKAPAGQKMPERHSQIEISGMRTMGRGGLGSRPRPAPTDKPGKSKSKKGLLSRLDVGKASKGRSNEEEFNVPNYQHLYSRISPERSSESGSSKHFPGERRAPPPDSFGAQGPRRNPVTNVRYHDIEENVDVERPAPHAVRHVRSVNDMVLRPLRDVPTSVSQDSFDSLSGQKQKINRHESGLSFLLTTFKSTTTHKPRLRESMSTPSLHSDGASLVSDDKPSSSSDRTSASSHEMENGFMSSYRSSIVETINSDSSMHNDNVRQPTISITPPTQPHKGQSINLTMPNFLLMSSSEVAALGGPKSTDLVPFVTPTQGISIVRESDEGPLFRRSVRQRHERIESWTGQWNAEIFDVIQALRELR